MKGIAEEREKEMWNRDGRDTERQIHSKAVEQDWIEIELYGTFQNDCFVSGLLQESVGIEYIEKLKLQKLYEKYLIFRIGENMRGFRVFQKLENFGILDQRQFYL